jgi:hypothetical protein
MLSEKFPNWLGDINYRGDLSKYYIQAAIPKPDMPSLDTFLSEFTHTVVAFYRKRTVEPERNFEEKEDDWNKLIKDHVANPKTLVCVYAVSKEECQLPSYIDTAAKNIYIIRTMEEAIYFFHRCDVVFMNDTGMADFAKNCATKKIVFRTSDDHKIFIAQAYYNPFQTDIHILDEDYIFYP